MIDAAILLAILAILAWIAAIVLSLMAGAIAVMALLGWLFDRAMTRWMRGL